MMELEINAQLVGCKVCNPARPEWGVGTVLRVQSTTVGGRTVQRVSVQFATGHRQLVAPPARLVEPQVQDQPEREAGWLTQLAGQAPDDRLVQLPASVRDVLGTPAQRIVALGPMYDYDEQPTSLSAWARRQAEVADPLSLWSRDELLVAFRRFCIERDTHLRMLAALLVDKEGREALACVLAELPEARRAAVTIALQRAI